jgi:hypothetical protein
MNLELYKKIHTSFNHSNTRIYKTLKFYIQNIDYISKDDIFALNCGFVLYSKSVDFNNFLNEVKKLKLEAKTEENKFDEIYHHLSASYKNQKNLKTFIFMYLYLSRAIKYKDYYNKYNYLESTINSASQSLGKTDGDFAFVSFLHGLIRYYLDMFQYFDVENSDFLSEGIFEEESKSQSKIQNKKQQKSLSKELDDVIQETESVENAKNDDLDDNDLEKKLKSEEQLRSLAEDLKEVLEEDVEYSPDPKKQKSKTGIFKKIHKTLIDILTHLSRQLRNKLQIDAIARMIASQMNIFQLMSKDNQNIFRQTLGDSWPSILGNFYHKRMIALVRELSPESKIDALKNALAISAQKSLINTVDTEPKVTEALKDYGLSEKLVSQEKINQENLRRSEQIEHAKKIASELSQKASKEVHATIMEKAYRNPELTAISHQKLSNELLSAMHIGVVQIMQNFTPPPQAQNTVSPVGTHIHNWPPVINNYITTITLTVEKNEDEDYLKSSRNLTPSDANMSMHDNVTTQAKSVYTENLGTLSKIAGPFPE